MAWVYKVTHLISLLNGNEAGELSNDGEVGTQLDYVILSVLLRNLTIANHTVEKSQTELKKC